MGSAQSQRPHLPGNLAEPVVPWGFPRRLLKKYSFTGALMRTNLIRLALGVAALAVALTATSARAVFGQVQADPLLGALEAAAALPGAPSFVSAAGLTRANERLLTLEHTRSTTDPARRLVIVGGLDGTPESAEAVLAAVRWFKADRPGELRGAWTVSALPCGRPPLCLTGAPSAGGATAGAAAGAPEQTQRFPPVGGFYNDETSPESRYLWRWVAFQAPDLVLEVRSGPALSWELSEGTDALRLDGPRPPTGTLAAAISVGAPSGLAPVAAVRATTNIADAPQMLRSVLEAASAFGRSPLHEALIARANRTPREIARVLADRYPTTPSVSYVPAITWSNTLRLGGAAARELGGQLEPFLSGETPTASAPYRLTNLAGHFALVDYSDTFVDRLNTGRGDDALDLAIAAAELMLPESSDAIVRSATGWTDDMFMVSSLLSRVGQRTGQPQYGELVVRLLTSYTENLRRSDGLFVHSTRGPQAWGRGNGFAILGMTEALTYLPVGWADRSQVLGIYQQHAETLARHQAPDGMWNQVVDEPGSYRELTVTSMTLVALARGVRLGWLDDSYRAAIDRAWRGVATHIAEDGGVVDASTSTGAGETKQYYLDRTAVFGSDDRGGAMALWAATELEALVRWEALLPR